QNRTRTQNQRRRGAAAPHQAPPPDLKQERTGRVRLTQQNRQRNLIPSNQIRPMWSADQSSNCPKVQTAGSGKSELLDVTTNYSEKKNEKDYSQRAAVRAALAQDPSWISEYICKALPLLTAQDNEVSYLVPWSRLKSPPQQGGVFELATFRMRPGGPAVWGGAFQAAMSAHDAPGYGKLLGAFHSEFGLLNRVHALWWFESADHRAECRHKAHTDARVVAAVRNSVAHLDSQRNQLMFPCTFSPMK
uniref:NIPSNAP domain-containing protein n=1 Tax=Xiphophorus couchianus TaxID=32473 RepID=A0A3B5MDK4_9TELE